MERADKLRDIAHVQKFIKLYLMLGLRHSEVELVMSTVDSIVTRMHIQRRILKCMGLDRSKSEPEPLDVASFFIDQLVGHWELYEYMTSNNIQLNNFLKKRLMSSQHKNTPSRRRQGKTCQ